MLHPSLRLHLLLLLQENSENFEIFGLSDSKKVYFLDENERCFESFSRYIEFFFAVFTKTSENFRQDCKRTAENFRQDIYAISRDICRKASRIYTSVIFHPNNLYT